MNPNNWKVSYFNFVDADDDFKKAFEGWTIIRMAHHPSYQYDPKYEGSEVTSSYVEGGLTFYLEKRDDLNMIRNRRVILGYTELGEWIEHIKEAWEDDAPLLIPKKKTPSEIFMGDDE